MWTAAVLLSDSAALHVLLKLVLLMRKSTVSHPSVCLCFTPAVCCCVLLGSELKVTLR